MNISFTPPIRNVAELLHRLGDIPADRVRWTPIPGTATIDDLLKPGNDLCELVDGTLVEKTVGQEESFLGVWLLTLMSLHNRTHNLGVMTKADGFYELPSGPVRGPDIAFVAWDDLPGRRRNRDPIPLLAPTLAVEILSPSNSKAEMARKRDEYFRGGVRAVWEIDPRDRWVRVYTAADTYTELTAADTLTGDPVLAGFALKLADLFAELDRHG